LDVNSDDVLGFAVLPVIVDVVCFTKRMVTLSVVDFAAVTIIEDDIGTGLSRR